MGEDERDETTITGIETLEAAWWEAVEELRCIIMTCDNTQDRITACDVLLGYTSRMNQGLNAPFIPQDRPELEEDEDD